MLPEGAAKLEPLLKVRGGRRRVLLIRQVEQSGKWPAAAPQHPVLHRHCHARRPAPATTAPGGSPQREARPRWHAQVLEAQGQALVAPSDRAGLHPLLVPLALEAGSGRVTCLLRWAEPGTHKVGRCTVIM